MYLASFYGCQTSNEDTSSISTYIRTSIRSIVFVPVCILVPMSACMDFGELCRQVLNGKFLALQHCSLLAHMAIRFSICPSMVPDQAGNRCHY